MLILNHLWFSLCFFLFIVYIQNVLKLNVTPEYESSMQPSNDYPVLVICLKLLLKESKGKCTHLPEKAEFDCEMKYQLGCHTKGFEQLKKKTIRRKIENCSLEKQILAYEGDPRPDLFITQDKVCLRFDHRNFSVLYRGWYYFKFNKATHHDYYIHLVDTNRSKIKNSLFHRKCFLDKSNNDTFSCRNAIIGVSSVRVQRHRNCVAYKDYQNQFDCLRACYKRYYSNQMKGRKKSNCLLIDCPYDDCKETYYFVETLAKSNEGHGILSVSHEITVTTVLDYINRDAVFAYVVGILSSLFGFNFLNQSFRLHRYVQQNVYSFLIRNFRIPHRTILYTSERLRKHIRILLIAIVTIVCLHQSFKSLSGYFSFHRKNLFYFDFEQNFIDDGITLSVCFEIDKIYTPQADCNLTTCTIKQLAAFTMNADELINAVELKSISKIQNISLNDTHWFFKDGHKCFDFTFIFHLTLLDYYLKTSEIRIQSKEHFKHIYVRKKDYYATFKIMKQSFADLTVYAERVLKENELFHRTCKDYEDESKMDQCFCKQSCIESCMKERYLNKYKNLSPQFIITRTDINQPIGEAKFGSNTNQTDFELMSEECDSQFIDNCDSLLYWNFNTTFGGRSRKLEEYVEFKVKLIILSQTTLSQFKVKFDDVVYNFINLTSLWFGFSLSFVQSTLVGLLNRSHRTRAFLNVFKNLCLIASAIVFYIHLDTMIVTIARNDTYPMMHMLESKKNYVPRISFCLRYKFNNTDLTAYELESRTVSIVQLVDKLKLYDPAFNKIVVDKTNISDYVYDGLDHIGYTTKNYSKKGKLREMFKIKPFYIGVSKCFDFINRYKYGLIDYRLKGNPPILEMQLNRSLKGMVVILNDFEKMNLENWHQMYRRDNLELSYKRLKTKYIDNLYYLKRPFELFRPRTLLTQFEYFKMLQEEFHSKYNRTTTTLPLIDRRYFGTKIDNQLFYEFYANRSDYEQDLESELCLAASFKETKFIVLIKTIDSNREKTLLKIYPHFLQYVLIVSNKLTICELILNFTLIFNLHFGICFCEFPSFFFINLCRFYRLLKIYFTFLSKKL